MTKEKKTNRPLMSLASRSHSFQLLREPRGKIVLAVFAAALVGFGWLFWSVSQTFEPSTSQLLRAAATAVSVPIILFWFHNREKLMGRARKLAWVLVLGIVVLFAAASAIPIVLNVIEPPEWDFLVFWLNGQVAARGLNFYEPASYQNFVLPISPSPFFKPEVLDVGFIYPPPTMLLFMPLGLVDFESGMVLWSAVQVAVGALCVVLIHKIFLQHSGPAELLFSVAIVAIVAGTFSTFQFAQTSFLALLMVLLFWRDHERMRGGVWLALGALVKPFLLILLMIPLLRKQANVIIGTLLTFITMSVLTIGFVGTETFFTYFTDNPAGRAADFLYTETTNPSLLATILRARETSVDGQSALFLPLHIGIAVILIAITGWLLYSLEDKSLIWGLGLVLVLGLMIYPASQIFYSVLLTIPLIVVWIYRRELPVGVWGTGLLITGVLVFTAIAGYVFLANMLLWASMVILSIWTLKRGGLESPERLGTHELIPAPESNSVRRSESLQ